MRIMLYKFKIQRYFFHALYDAVEPELRDAK